jgi:chlorobactene glucosyltransferase
VTLFDASSLNYYQLALTAILVIVGLNMIANLRMLSGAAPTQGQTIVRQSVSALIPARNEAHNIERCVRSLLAQEYPIAEVLVLDDNSTDDTAAVVERLAAEDRRVRLIKGDQLPQGWMGKNFACHQMAEVASGDWLLFTDADTDHRPGAMAWAMGAAQRGGADLVSLIPHSVVHTLGEEVLLPIIPLGLLGLLPLWLGTRIPIAYATMAIGTYMLFRRQAYTRIGGHEGVCGEICEDVRLARKLRRNGGNIVLLDGSDHLEVHFYHGFRDAWHGLAKSAFAALDYRVLPVAIMIAFYGFLFLWPGILLVGGLLQGRLGDPSLRLAILHVALNAGLCYTLAVRFRLPRRTALMFPITILLTIVILFDGMRQVFVSGTGWKERRYHVEDGVLRH